VLAAVVAGVLRLLHATEHNLVAGVAGVAVGSLIWLPVTRRWSAGAHLCWSSSVFLFVVYLVFALRWTFESHLGPASTVGGVLLCCKGCAGFVVNATAIIPQTDEALRILLAVSFRVGNRLLNIDFRLRWCVNGTHLSLCVVAPFEVPDRHTHCRVRQQEIYARLHGALSTGL